MGKVHCFQGKWITDIDFANQKSRNVFHRQLDKVEFAPDKNENSHILFRKRFTITKDFLDAKIYITADDYYKLYINGKFVSQGPAPSYNTNYNYNETDITEYLQKGENVIAVHTYYQGLINRVWQSGDHRHGLLLDVMIDGCLAINQSKLQEMRTTLYSSAHLLFGAARHFKSEPDGVQFTSDRNTVFVPSL